MDETINMEGVAGQSGEGGEPSQTSSSSQQTQASAIDEESLKAFIEPMIQAEVERRTQSIKDKRIAKQEGRIKTLEESLAELRELQSEGLSEKTALQFLQMRDELTELRGTPDETSPTNEPAPQKQVTVEEYLSPILRLGGLKEDDPDVLSILRKERDPARQMRALGELAESRKQEKSTPANPAATLPSGAGTPTTTRTLEVVDAELNAEISKPVKNMERIRELKIEHAQLLPKR